MRATRDCSCLHVCLVSRYVFGCVKSFRINTPSLAHDERGTRTHARGGAPARPSGRRQPHLHAPGAREARVARVQLAHPYSTSARSLAKSRGVGFLFERMGRLSREVINRGHDDTRVISKVFARCPSVSGGPPAVCLKLARRGSMINHANGQVGKGGEDVEPAPGLHAANAACAGGEVGGEAASARACGWGGWEARRRRAALAGRSSNQVGLCSGGGGWSCSCAASTGVGAAAAAGTTGVGTEGAGNGALAAEDEAPAEVAVASSKPARQPKRGRSGETGWHYVDAWQGGCAPMERGVCVLRTACFEPLRLPACRPAQGRDIPHSDSSSVTSAVGSSWIWWSRTKEKSATTLASSKALACWAEKGWSSGGT
eukprot:5664033-Pleurochrysis_carterae.AAC.2